MGVERDRSRALTLKLNAVHSAQNTGCIALDISDALIIAVAAVSTKHSLITISLHKMIDAAISVMEEDGPGVV